MKRDVIIAKTLRKLNERHVDAGLKDILKKFVLGLGIVSTVSSPLAQATVDDVYKSLNEIHNKYHSSMAGDYVSETSFKAHEGKFTVGLWPFFFEGEVKEDGQGYTIQMSKVMKDTGMEERLDKMKSESQNWDQIKKVYQRIIFDIQKEVKSAIDENLPKK